MIRYIEENNSELFQILFEKAASIRQLGMSFSSGYIFWHNKSQPLTFI